MNVRMEPFPSASTTIPGRSPRVSSASDDRKTLESVFQTKAIPVQTTATVSPRSSSAIEMIDYLSLQTRSVASNPVGFYLMLAEQFTNKNDLPMALEYYSQALRIVNRVAPKSKTEQLRMSDILFCIGRIHLNLRDMAKALVVFDICYNIRRRILDWDDKGNAIVLQQQAYIYSSVGDSESAVQVLEELLGILCCVEVDTKTLRETWLELARHQELLGMDVEATSSREEASQLP
mmetsp:Transcript_19395/g.36638  ORF Transcript_19395/g.36638 Transcript_19395/m.36638 type:complete len:234 (+) Transcript_19395:62-763(+)